MSTLSSEQDDITLQLTLLEQSVVAADDACVAQDHDNAKDSDFSDESTRVNDFSNENATDNDFNDEVAKNDDFNNAAATIQRSDSRRFLGEMNSCEMEASFTVCRDQSSNSTSPHLIGGERVKNISESEGQISPENKKKSQNPYTSTGRGGRFVKDTNIPNSSMELGPKFESPLGHLPCCDEQQG